MKILGQQKSLLFSLCTKIEAPKWLVRSYPRCLLGVARAKCCAIQLENSETKLAHFSFEQLSMIKTANYPVCLDTTSKVTLYNILEEVNIYSIRQIYIH